MILSRPHLLDRLSTHEPREEPTTERTRHAAVAAVLRYASSDGWPEVLLIRRTSHPHDPWSGHMAFPGGRHDDSDRDLLHTARRETEEEVGVDLASDADFFGRLDDVQAISRARPMDLIIVPHVFVLRREVALIPDAAEVAEALWAPIRPMVEGEIDTTRRYEREGVNLELPGYRVGSNVVWGLTYSMLQLLFDVART
jgi:8-oxo-dGTP pyrophosphatase MutT (NUDIX family)